MKKFLSLLCMITCVFGLTACGTTEELTAHEQELMEIAKVIATDVSIPSFDEFRDEANIDLISQYSAEELEAVFSSAYGGIEIDGYAYMTGIESFNSAYDTIGERVSLGEPTAEINGKQIIVRVPVVGEKAEAEAEFVFTKDNFMVMESAALNPKASMSDLMTKAALNTLIGMGTVFAVLILIIAIISCFSIIPKLQAKMSKKDTAEAKTAGIDKAVAQITSQEEKVKATVVSEAVTDDTELIAVISAAIAASMGTTSTDGFVVRSIRRVRRR